MKKSRSKHIIPVFGVFVLVCFILTGIFAFLYWPPRPREISLVPYEYINPNMPTSVKRGVVFAAYEKNGRIPDYVIRYLQELKKTGSDIVFISDNPVIPSEIEKIKDLVLYAKFEKHGEYDFGSYKRGLNFLLERHLLDDKSHLILCNDSVYGPFSSLSDIFDQMNQKDSDFWGLTSYDDFQYHLQSYFLYFKNSKLIQKDLKAFLDAVKHEESKDDVVINYETKLTGYLEQKGYKSSSYIPCPFFALSIGDQVFKVYADLSSEYPDLLLTKYNFPFLKKRTLVDAGVPKLEKEGYLRYIQYHYPEFYELIVLHLEENGFVKRK